MGYKSGLAPGNQTPLSSGPDLSSVTQFPGIHSFANAEAGIAKWIEITASSLGMEAVPTSARYSELEQFIRTSAPALLRIGEAAGTLRWVALVRGGGRSAKVLGPDFQEHRLPLMSVRNLLCADLESPLQQEVEALIAQIGISTRRSAATRAAILRERLGSVSVGQCWVFHLALGSPFLEHLRRAGMFRRCAALTAAHCLRVALALVSWWLIGGVALGGQFEQGWLIGWGLLLLTVVPVRHIVLWVQGLLALGGGCSLKQQLLYGALNLKPEQIRHRVRDSFSAAS